MLLAKWSSKKFLRNVFQVYNIIRHHRYSSTSPFLMLKIVAQNFHLQWQKYKHAKKRSFYVNVNSNQISQNKKYFKITIPVSDHKKSRLESE